MGGENLVNIDDIVKDVCNILEKIISNHSEEIFEEQGSFKVRPGYGYDKFFIDKIDGSYDMSLQGLIHYILYEENLYEKFLNEKQIKDLNYTINEFPKSIYTPNENDDNYEQVQYKYLDVIYNRAIRFVGNKLLEEGPFEIEGPISEDGWSYDIKGVFSEYL